MCKNGKQHQEQIVRLATYCVQETHEYKSWSFLKEVLINHHLLSVWVASRWWTGNTNVPLGEVLKWQWRTLHNKNCYENVPTIRDVHLNTDASNSIGAGVMWNAINWKGCLTEQNRQHHIKPIKPPSKCKQRDLPATWEWSVLQVSHVKQSNVINQGLRERIQLFR